MPALRADAARNRARILAAADEVFAEHGAAASTEEVARRAGVAVGTVFRHFPAKQDLLVAIMKALLERLREQAAALAGRDDGLFVLFRQVVDEASARTTVLSLLAEAGRDVDVQALTGLQEAVETLLRNGIAAGTVRGDLDFPQVMALLHAVTQAALRGWPGPLRDQVLTVVLDGMRPRPR
jgi:AcrR family transcriptional regulator